MADTSAGFRFRGRICGAPPTIQDLLFQGTETLTKGDMVTLDTGELDLSVTTDTHLLGVVLETISGTDSTTRIRVIVDSDAIYGVYDANARLKGAALDIAGTTGAMTVASATNKDVLVYAESTATEETLITFNTGHHHNMVATA
jgi:hypothetical protein